MKNFMMKMVVIGLLTIMTFAGCGGNETSEPTQPTPILETTPTPSPEPTPTSEPAPTPEPEIATPFVANTVVQVFPLTDDFTITTATELNASIRIGWNLGNTLDAWGDRYGFAWLGDGVYANTSIAEMETAWVGHVATQGLINAVSDAGFNALRVPVTWFKATDENFIIREDWMARVKEVVNYGLENNMYVILNSHHDETIFRFLDEYMDESLHAFEIIWQQIAETFRDYDERLIFQGLNEPRTPGSPAEWSGGTPEERANINIYNQLFVDTIRRTGGNNTERVLMLTTHAASAESVAQRAFIMPYDSAEDRIIVNLHIYSPWEFALRTGSSGVRDTWDASLSRDTNPIVTPLNLAYELFVSQGVPVAITETGALNRDNIDARAEWAEFFVSYARSLEIPIVWWDNGIGWVTAANAWGGYDETFGLFDRITYEKIHPEIIFALMRATV